MLGVPRDATERQIKDAFRSLALQFHPDRNKSPDAEERFKEIAAAYAVLSDPAKRRDYDERGFAGVAGVSEEDLFGSVDFRDLFGGLNFDFTGLHPDIGGGVFDSFYGRRRNGPPRGENIEVELEVPLERVASGGEQKLNYTRPVTCGACGGTGAKAGTQPRPCPACSGSGRKVQESRRRQEKGEVRVQSIAVCGSCQGSGQLIDQRCPECAGQGRAEREESLTVDVPVGAEEGMALRVPGHGMPSDGKGGIPGDLFVIVRSSPDPRFERRGANLWHGESLTIPEAVLGVTRRVPTLDGGVEVTIPAGTQPDTVLRLAGKGLPEFGGAGCGDLYLRVRLIVPRHLTADQRKLYERLGQIEHADDRKGG